MYITQQQFDEYLTKILSECVTLNCASETKCAECKVFEKELRKSRIITGLKDRLLDLMTHNVHPDEALIQCFASALNFGYTVAYEHLCNKKLEEIMK